MHLINDNTIAYPASCNLIIYDIKSKSQTFLRSHTNIITSCIISNDKKLIITGDSGASDKSSLIGIWDTNTNELIGQHMLPHGYGVEHICLSNDKTMMGLILNETLFGVNNKIKIVQHLLICNITPNIIDSNKLDVLIKYQTRINNNEIQNYINISDNNDEIITQSNNKLIIWKISYKNIDNKDSNINVNYYLPKINDSFTDTNGLGCFTETIFIPNKSTIVTATKNGNILLWDYDDTSNNDSISFKKKQRSLIKVIKLIKTSINCIQILNDLIMVAGKGGCIRFFDFHVCIYILISSKTPNNPCISYIII